MSKMKIDRSNIRNLELLRTYYSIPKTKQKNILFSRAVLISIILFILITTTVFVGYFLVAKKSNVYNNRATALYPVKQYGNIFYYKYEQIKNNKAPIVLSRENICAAINFDEAKNLTGSIVSFMAKGQRGSEKIAIILKDNYNFSNANKNDIILTSLLSKNKWQGFSIKLDNLYLPLNKNKITQLRFDISGSLTENDLQATVYIKKIFIE